MIQSSSLTNNNYNNLLVKNKNYMKKMPIEVIEKIISYLNIANLVSYTKTCGFINRIITHNGSIEKLLFNKLQLSDEKKQLISCVYNHKNYITHIRNWLLNLGLETLVNNLDCRRDFNFHKVLYLQLIRQLAFFCSYTQGQNTKLATISSYIRVAIITQNKNQIKSYTITTNDKLAFVANCNYAIAGYKAKYNYATSKDQKYHVFLIDNSALEIYNPLFNYEFSPVKHTLQCAVELYKYNKLCLGYPIANMCFNKDANLLAVTVNVASKKRLKNKIFTAESLLFYKKIQENNWQFFLSMLSRSDFIFQEYNFTDRNTILLPETQKVIEYDLRKKSCINEFVNVNFVSYGGGDNLALTMIINGDKNKKLTTTFVNKICIYQYDNDTVNWKQQQILSFSCLESIRNILFSDCGNLLAVNSSNYLEIYNKNSNWELIKKLVIDTDEIKQIEFSIDGNYVVLQLRFDRQLIVLN